MSTSLRFKTRLLKRIENTSNVATALLLYIDTMLRTVNLRAMSCFPTKRITTSSLMNLKSLFGNQSKTNAMMQRISVFDSFFKYNYEIATIVIELVPSTCFNLSKPRAHVIQIRAGSKKHYFITNDRVGTIIYAYFC